MLSRARHQTVGGLISIHFHHSLAFVRPALQADTVCKVIFTTGLALDEVF